MAIRSFLLRSFGIKLKHLMNPVASPPSHQHRTSLCPFAKMSSLTVSLKKSRELRAMDSDGRLISLAVILKDGTLYQCYPPEYRGARFPSEDKWSGAWRNHVERERKSRGRAMHRAKKDARAAVKKLREMRRVDPDLTHNTRAASLRELVTRYDEMAEDANRLYWRAERAKKELRRALETVRDPLEGFVGEER